MKQRGDRGIADGVFGLPLILLTFVAGTLIASTAWATVDAKTTATRAARDGARWVAETVTVGDDPASVRAGVAAAVVASMGRSDPEGIDIVVEPAAPTRCDIVLVTVSVEVPAVAVPFLDVDSAPRRVTASHRRIVDPLRSGVAGTARCIR